MTKRSEKPDRRWGIWRKYLYGWLTILFFLVSFALHWFFGWRTFVDDAAQQGQVPELSAYLNEMLRDMFENWQSEFLQLLWQVLGLAYFLYVGSPSSKESGDRVEAKIDALLRAHHGENAERIIAALDEQYLRHEGHAKPHQ